MKLLLVLLACIAATNAITYRYCNYSYRYYQKHRFYVYPAKSYYCYRVYFNNAWCSSKYYDSILFSYPGTDCQQETWTERPVAELKTEVQNKLAEVLVKISTEITARRDKFFIDLDACHAEYKRCYTDNITRYYDYCISRITDEAEKQRLRDERDRKIAEYCTCLNERREKLWKQYNDAIAEKIKVIQDYHTCLCDGVERCLTTRLEKIEAYAEELGQRCLTYTQRYWDYLNSIAKCRGEQYRQALQCVHGKDWNKDKIDFLIQQFVSKECTTYKVGALAEYVAKLLATKLRLLKFYQCSYTCTFSTCALRFYKRRYYSYCRSIGNWYCYSRITYKTRSGIAPFRYRWRKTVYKCLTKCDLGKLHKSAEEYKTEFEALLQERVDCLIGQFTSWKVKWAEYHVEYCLRMDKIIEERHNWAIRDRRAYYICLNNSNVLTPEQEADLVKLADELKAKREATVAEYKAKLLASIIKCGLEFTASIEKYKETTNNLITSIITKYTECLETRLAKIAEYRKCLEDSGKARREKMVDHMVEVKNAHLECYKDLHVFYMGDPLPTCVTQLQIVYALELVAYCNGILEEFSTCWATQLEELVHHYSCNYRCRIGCFSLPRYCWGSYYSWRVCYPKANYYCYSYRRYRTYCNYHVRYTKGCYRYVC